MPIQHMKDYWIAAKSFIIATLSWLIFTPLSILIPKKNHRVVVIGRDNGLFVDNAKHFYLYLIQQGRCNCVFITMNAVCYKHLDKIGLPVVLHPSLSSFFYLLTAQFVVIDSAEWMHRGIYQAAYCSKLVQLWHGAPLKQIEIPLYLQRKSALPRYIGILLELQKTLIGRYPRFDLVISTSVFFSHAAFLAAFRSKVVIGVGYPRNDAMLKYRDDVRYKDSNIWINTDTNALKIIQQARTQGQKIILYAPTFRKEMHDPFQPEILDIDSFSSFASKNGILVVMKLHPTMAGRMRQINDANICIYNSASDIYPALSLFECLITDYSSIFFDFLLLGRPIVFFCYDLEKYKSKDRSLLFDFDAMTPGPKCHKQSDLEDTLKLLLIETEDAYSEDRRRVCDLVFDFKDDQSSARIWKYMKDSINE